MKSLVDILGRPRVFGLVLFLMSMEIVIWKMATDYTIAAGYLITSITVLIVSQDVLSEYLEERKRKRKGVV